MKKLVLLFSVILFTLSSCKEEKTKQNNTKPTKKESVKPSSKKIKNSLVWKGYKPTGFHVGTIDIKSTDFKFKGTQLIGGTVVFDMNTIKDIDLKDAGDNADLVNHLKSTDFFDVVSHPTSKFEITAINSDKLNNLEIIGKLTLNGITKEIKFPATIKGNNGSKFLISKVIKIDRTDFGVKYKSKKFFANLKDRFINDEFDITFKINLN